MSVEYYYQQKDFMLYLGNCLQILPEFKSESVQLVFADPPYFLSNDGITCKSGKMVSVNKGKWDKSKGLQKDYEFTVQWLKACRRILADNGSIWVSGTFHNIFTIGFALKQLGFECLNDITWFKPNAPPNLSCRYFTHSHETLIWAKKSKKSKHIFNYETMKNWGTNSDSFYFKGKQMRSIWSIPFTPPREKTFGSHPTQKPVELLKRIIMSSSNEGDVILDPFNGSGTTGIAARMLRRHYVGIDSNKDYLDLTIQRIKECTVNTDILSYSMQ